MNFVIRLTPKSKPTWDNPEESIGERVCSIRSGKYTCWEAVGRAQRAWNTILPEIKRFFQLDDYATLFDDICKYDFGFDVYMIGREKKTAFPIIFVCSKDKSTRKTIRKLIKENGFLDRYPGMEVGDRPGFPEPLAGEAGQKDAALTVYTPSDDERILGRQLLIRGARKTRKATGGPIVWINEQPFQLTVSHVLEDSDEQPTTSDDEASVSTADDWSFDGDSDVDDDEDDVPSGGSRTPDELISRDSDDDAQASGDSRFERSRAPVVLPSLLLPPSHAASMSSLEGAERTEIQQSVSRLTAAADGVEHESLHRPTVANEDMPLSLQKMLGTIHFASMGDNSESNLDYALVDVLWESLGGTVQVSEYLAKCAKLSLASTLQSHNVKVSVWTSSSQPIQGTLSATSSYWRTKRSKILQEVIPLRVTGVLNKGDCGAAVIDMSTGHFYGLVVAGTPGTSFGFIMPAWHIFHDIQQRVGSKAVLSPSSEIGNHPLYKAIKPADARNNFPPLLVQAPAESEWKLTAALPLAPSFRGNNERVEVFSRENDATNLRIDHVEVEAPEGSERRRAIFFSRPDDGDGAVTLLYPFLRMRNLNRHYSILIGKATRDTYDFQSPEAAFIFQGLLTGYEVVHSFRDINCSSTRREARTLLPRVKSFTGRGELQIWRENKPGSQLSELSLPQEGQWDSVSPPRVSLVSGKDDVANPTKVGTRGGISSPSQSATVHRPAHSILVAFLEDSQGGTLAVLTVPSKLPRLRNRPPV